jgi:transposase
MEMYFTDAMPNPYDVALRERAVAAYESGEGSYAHLAAVFDLDHRTVERWVARWRQTGSVAPQPKGGGWRCPIDTTVLHAVIQASPDGTIDELCRAYNRRVRRAQQTSARSLRRAMGREGFVLKNNARARAKSTGRTSKRSAPRS